MLTQESVFTDRLPTFIAPAPPLVPASRCIVFDDPPAFRDIEFALFGLAIKEDGGDINFVTHFLYSATAAWVLVVFLQAERSA